MNGPERKIDSFPTSRSWRASWDGPTGWRRRGPPHVSTCRPFEGLVGTVGQGYNLPGRRVAGVDPDKMAAAFQLITLDAKGVPPARW